MYTLAQKILCIFAGADKECQDCAPERVRIRVPAKTRWVVCQSCDTPTICRRHAFCYGPVDPRRRT